MKNQEIAINKKVVIQFTIVTFCIAYSMSGALIVLGKFGYSVYNWVSSAQQFVTNIPFSVYILSPAIASYLVLRWNKIMNLREWIKTVFYMKNSIFLYLYVCAVLLIYFFVHALISNRWITELPFYTFFFSLPGSLVIGGLEEAGWSYILQPVLKKQYGFAISSILFGIIWVLWHIPLFFIPGTNHGEGLINFWMFAVQLVAFRFIYGAIYEISGKDRVFMCVLFHTMFNAVSPVFGTLTMTWRGTIAANMIMILTSIVTIIIYNRKPIT